MQSGLRGGRAEHGQDLGHDGVQLLGEVVERAELENLNQTLIQEHESVEGF